MAQDPDDASFHGAESDPWQFRFPADEMEAVIDPSLNQDLPLKDSALHPTKWSKSSVWYHESITRAGDSIQRVLCLDTDAERYVVIRSTGSELEASQFATLIIDCGIHPNALPLRIH